MPNPHAGLATDFVQMRNAAQATDTCSVEVTALLKSFLNRITGVPPAVWSGAAAGAFQEAMTRWNAESVRLTTALDAISDTIRHNEVCLREAAARHAHQVTVAAADL